MGEANLGDEGGKVFEGIRWRVRFGARLGVVIDVRFARA